MRCKRGCQIRRVLKRAKASPPREAAEFKKPQLRLLVALCQQLQRDAGSDPFYLTCRAAGELLRVSHITAWRWLTKLCDYEILRVVETGTFPEHRASRYRYIKTR